MLNLQIEFITHLFRFKIREPNTRKTFFQITGTFCQLHLRQQGQGMFEILALRRIVSSNVILRTEL